MDSRRPSEQGIDVSYHPGDHWFLCITRRVFQRWPTVHGSEIPRPTTWDVLNHGQKLPTSTCEGRISEPSTVLLFEAATTNSRQQTSKKRTVNPTQSQN